MFGHRLHSVSVKLRGLIFKAIGPKGHIIKGIEPFSA